MAGSLVDNGAVGTIDVNITGSSVPVWAVTVDGIWDIDATGTGAAGTANWSATGGPNTYVENAAVGIDSVIFNDTGVARPNVTLATAVAPISFTANHSIHYAFSGPGRITGATTISKSGTGTLTFANTGTNDFSGGITINAGTVRLGDGATSGAGSIGSGLVTLNANGTLELNRPDNFTASI